MLRANVDHTAGSNEIKKYSGEGKVNNADVLFHRNFNVDIVNGIKDAIQVNEQDRLAFA